MMESCIGEREIKKCIKDAKERREGGGKVGEGKMRKMIICSVAQWSRHSGLSYWRCEIRIPPEAENVSS